MTDGVPLLGFRAGTGGVVVDLDRLVASRMLVQANSGGGKSRALRYLLEQTHGRVQHIVVDPEGEFASLRERYDYLLAGREGDVPADPRSAKLLCRRLLELGTSAVLDLYDLSLPDRRKFVRLFLEELMHLPRTLWRPCLVVVDEVHVFCPERGSGEAESTDAVITLCTQGRKRGYALVGATQRLSKLHKDAAAELLNKLIGRTGLDVDLKRAGDDLGFDKEQRQSLKTMAPGTFYAYGPAITPTVTLVRTGAVATSHPEAGRVAAPPPPAPTAIRAMLGELRDLPQQAEEEARTVEDLSRQVRELRTKLRQAQQAAPAPDPAAVQQATERAVAQATRELRVRQEHQLRELTRRLPTAATDLRATADMLEAIQARAAEVLAVVPEPTHAVEMPRAARERQGAPRASGAAIATAPTVTTGLSGTQQRIVNALAFYAELGQDVVSRPAVAGLIGVTHTAGSFSNNLSALRQRGMIADAADAHLALTSAGHEVATDRPAVASLADLHALWLSHRALSGTQRRMVEQLVGAYPATLTRQALADAIGVQATSGSFSNNLSRLRTMGLMADVSRTEVVATDLLFPEGLT